MFLVLKRNISPIYGMRQKKYVKITKKTEWKSLDTRQRARCDSYSILLYNSPGFYLRCLAEKSVFFHVVLYTIGKKLSSWKMKKSWNSPEILFTHFHTGKCISWFADIYAYCRYFIDWMW